MCGFYDGNEVDDITAPLTKAQQRAAIRSRIKAANSGIKAQQKVVAKLQKELAKV